MNRFYRPFFMLALAVPLAVLPVGCASTGGGQNPITVITTPIDPVDAAPILDVLEIALAHRVSDPRIQAAVQDAIDAIRSGGVDGQGASIFDAAMIAGLQAAIRESKIEPEYLMFAAIAADRLARLPAVESNPALHRILVTVYNVSMDTLREMPPEDPSE